jgi:hypothetical protein
LAQTEEKRVVLGQFLLPGLLLLTLCTLVVYRFTSRTESDDERARARVILQSIYNLEVSHHKKHGSFIPINEISNSDILKLRPIPGRFRYRVDITDSSFLATAKADLDGDGKVEVWRVDRHSAQPFLLRED